MRLLAWIGASLWRLRVVIVIALSMVTIMTYNIHWTTNEQTNKETTAQTSLSVRNTSGDKMLQDLNIFRDFKDSSSTIDRTVEQVRFLEQYARNNNITSNTTGNITGRKSKSILIVGSFSWNFDEVQRAFVNDKCPITECTVTLDAEQQRRTVDAIIILNMDATKLQTFLPKPAHQIWIANHWESPLHNRIDTVAMSEYINWSSTYRPDSHIATPYGYVVRIPPSSVKRNTTMDLVNHAAGKTKQVAWFASNCYDKNGRTNYAYELSKYISVDIYGSCGLGKLKCSRSQCSEWLKKDYKFYLSFENSNCHYYMMEKLFVNALSNNVIPIVMGARRQDYASALPPHSYIHVDDFRSPRDLADYLRVLDSNDTLYNDYFRWKSEYTLEKHSYYSYWCLLCGLLHVASEQRYVHWYTDYSQWWDGYRGRTCASTWTENNGVSWLKWTV